jgi:uncharacterized protein (TIGR00375 family)
MQVVADLHLHSKYSRAVSQDMILPNMALWAKKKGIDLLSVSDWTHPLWLREIREELEETHEGLYKLKSEYRKSTSEKEPLFLLSVEISSIYSQKGKVHRIHNLVFVKNFEIAEKVNKELLKRGCNLMSDGRPIIGLSSMELLELILTVDDKSFIIPCHVWTPWFSLYGSNSGFDSIDEAFGKFADNIYAIETGLSSDPSMNWRIKELENRSIVSFSDAHSLIKMGREATVFELENPSYESLREALMHQSKGKNKILYTMEFYPEEGKYHYTGHRNCSVVQSPSETTAKGTICPVCKKPLTVGVMHRVDELSNGQGLNEESSVDENGVKWISDPKKLHPPFLKLVQLIQIIAEALSSSTASQKTRFLYEDLCSKYGSEINVLLKTPLSLIQKEFGDRVAEGISKVRKGDIFISPGFDGQYGIVKIWKDEVEIEKKSNPVNQLGIDF